jgi:hypothetical protein
VFSNQNSILEHQCYHLQLTLQEREEMGFSSMHHLS